MSAALRPAYPPILMSAAEAAAYLGISPRKLAALQAESRLIPKALDGSRGFLRDDLETFARGLPDWTGPGRTTH